MIFVVSPTVYLTRSASRKALLGRSSDAWKILSPIPFVRSRSSVNKKVSWRTDFYCGNADRDRTGTTVARGEILRRAMDFINCLITLMNQWLTLYRILAGDRVIWLRIRTHKHKKDLEPLENGEPSLFTTLEVRRKPTVPISYCSHCYNNYRMNYALVDIVD